MKFTFEEAELINSCFELDSDDNIFDVNNFINRLNNIKTNTDDHILLNILNTTIEKLETIDNNKFDFIIKSIPLNNFMNY